MMVHKEWSNPDGIFSTDVSNTGCGEFWQGSYFHATIPPKFNDLSYSIDIKEIFDIFVCLRLWGGQFADNRICVCCDNVEVCQITNSGRTYNSVLQT